jgi:SAM-dependent methyltransferase
LSASEQVRVNATAWRRGDHVGEYANRTLLPVEVMILVRYREALAGRTLEVGCGAGRILGYLAAIGDAHGIDISAAMVDHCRARYPAADTEVADLGDLGTAAPGPFEAILALDNVLDVFDDEQRRRVLADLKARIAPDGLLIFSSHNLAYIDRPMATERAAPAGGWRRGRELLAKAASRPPASAIRDARRIPRRIANRRRLEPLQRRGPGYAIVNDSAHDYALLHYYIGRDDQQRQLAETGLRLLECLDVDGRTVGAGEPHPDPWLHYVARPEIA